jgi:serine/threonine protein kinase
LALNHDYINAELEPKELERAMNENDNHGVLTKIFYSKFLFFKDNNFFGGNKDTDKREFDDKYGKEFREIKTIGSGSSGVVFQVENIFDKKLYAIKKVPVDKLRVIDIFKEINLLREMKCDFIVKFIDSWIEKNNFLAKEPTNDTKFSNLSSGHSIFNINKTLLVHIQMELCFETFKETKERFKSINPLNYYILCQLVIELLESVDYLHKLKPPIIHRDLKPANILISYGMDGRFIKLGDFGLATTHEFDEQSHTQGLGTFEYMSQDVIQSRKYDTRADIHSLSVILKQIFKE